MKKGMIFDLQQDGKPTVRVIAIDEDHVMCLSGCMGEIVKFIDFENEAGTILIQDVFKL